MTIFFCVCLCRERETERENKVSRLSFSYHQNLSNSAYYILLKSFYLIMWARNVRTATKACIPSKEWLLVTTHVNLKRGSINFYISTISCLYIYLSYNLGWFDNYWQEALEVKETQVQASMKHLRAILKNWIMIIFAMGIRKFQAIRT